MKRTLCCILAAIMLTVLCGCAQKQVETKKLWVVTEVFLLRWHELPGGNDCQAHGAGKSGTDGGA